MKPPRSTPCTLAELRAEAREHHEGSLASLLAWLQNRLRRGGVRQHLGYVREDHIRDDIATIVAHLEYPADKETADDDRRHESRHA